MSFDSAEAPPYLPRPTVDHTWVKRQCRQTALDAALKLSSVAEPEKRVVERARVIYDFLYGEEAK